jgi:ankyrin repeat protein
MSRTAPRTSAKSDNRTLFFKAAIKSDVAKLKGLLTLGQDVDVRDEAGRTALMRAAEHGQVEAARTLLAAGSDANATVSDRDSIWYGCNALISAAEGGAAQLAELLIKAGATPNCEAADGTTPLSIAVEQRSAPMVELLLKAGAPLGKDILVSSVWNSTSEVSLLLIEAGANVNARSDLGQSVLHGVAEKGQLEVLRALVKSKAKLNVRTNGDTPLLAAILNSHEECAIELIRAGADSSLTGMSRRNALMNASFLGQTEVVRALLEAGANANAKDKSGKTALMLANEKEHREIVELLRAGGSDDSGYQVQEYIRAALNGDVEGVRQLLDAGVDVNATYQNGAKALTSAIMKGHTEVVRLLISRKVNVNTVVSGNLLEGFSIKADALSVAAEEGHVEMVRLLIQAGADVNQSRYFQVDAVTRAAGAGHANVVRELIAAGFRLTGGYGKQALEAAVRAKREEATLALIDGGVRLQKKASANLLASAAEKGMSRVVKALLDHGADPKERNYFGVTPSQAAEHGGQTAVAAILRRAKSPQASPGMELIEAAERGDLRTVHRLIFEGVDLESRDAKGATALIRACAEGHLAVVSTLLKAGANPNATTNFVKRDKKKWFFHMDLTTETPLSCAVSALSLPAVNLLLDAGAEVQKTECGHVACMMLERGVKETLALVECLLDAGMNPDSRWPITNISLLEKAAQEGFADLVEKLVCAGARFKTALERDRSILDAIESARVDIARVLIERGIGEVKGTITPKALVAAAAAGMDEIVQLLLKRGVKVDRRADISVEETGGFEGVTALMAAASQGRESTVEILLKAGADPNAEDPIQRTALDYAQDPKNEGVRRRICGLIEMASNKK